MGPALRRELGAGADPPRSCRHSHSRPAQPPAVERQPTCVTASGWPAQSDVALVLAETSCHVRLETRLGPWGVHIDSH